MISLFLSRLKRMTFSQQEYQIISLLLLLLLLTYTSTAQTSDVEYPFRSYHQCDMIEEDPWGSLDLILLYFVEVVAK